MLNLSGWCCLVVGGGGVAARRAGTLAQAGAAVTMVAPVMSADATALSSEAVNREERAFADGDLAGVRLVVVATDDAAVNARVADRAAAAGVLVNRADRGDGGDLTLMAARRVGPLTVAVDSGGASPAAARTLVETARDAVGPEWPVLLEEAAARRAALRGRPDALRRLTDAAALDILQRCGRAALAGHLDTLVAESVARSPAG